MFVKNREQFDDETDPAIQKILEKLSQKGSVSALSSLDSDEKKRLVEYLRDMSRAKYLEDRERKELALFQRNLEEEEKLFEGMLLTRREQASLEVDREILELAKKIKVKGEAEYSYKMPLDYEDSQNRKQKKIQLFDRYEKANDFSRKTDEELWMSQQKSKANAKQEDDEEGDYLMNFEAELARKKLAAKEIEDELLREKRHTTQPKEQVERQILTSTQKIQQERQKLPIYAFRQQIVDTIKNSPITILVGETGSGKTTQLPQFLLEEGYGTAGKIVITQPRRVAAMSVASRVAYERECPLGTEVGYSVRFQACFNEQTLVKFMTDGMLLNELTKDPKLSAYSVIVIDEAHERTVDTDILFALVKDLLKERPALRLVIASATLDADKFSNYFENAPIINVPGRRFEVDIYYTKAPEPDYVEAAVITVLQIHVTQGPGDILVFLTGQEEIESAKEQINQRLRKTKMKLSELIVLGLYSVLPPEQQAKIFEATPKGARKVILSTNIAETSLTIPNIVFVIDSGFVKQTAYDPRTNIESLAVTPISRASADQRAGRAGRVCPGKCFRLYTLLSFQTDLEEIMVPEIQRCSLSDVILQLKCIGISNFVDFDFMDAPNEQVISRAMNHIYALGALNNEGDLTQTGIRMGALPLPASYSKCLIMSEKYKCVRQMITICAIMNSQQTLFYRPKELTLHADKARLEFEKPGGDHLSFLNAFMQWEAAGYSENFATDHFLQIRALRKAKEIKDQLFSMCAKIGIDVENNELSVTKDENVAIRKCLLSGFFMNTAKKVAKGTYRTVKKDFVVMLHPSSYLTKKEPEWVLFDEMVKTSREYIRNAVEIETSWLKEVAPFYFTDNDIEESDKMKNLKRIIATQDIRMSK